MRAYSSVNVIEEYLEKPSNFFGRFLKAFSQNAKVELEIMLPRRMYLKGELIAETVSDKANIVFSTSDLVDLLSEELLEYYSLNPNPLKLNRTFKEISSMSMIQRYYRYSKGDLIPVKIKLLKKDVFKLEMLLADIEEIEDRVDFTVESILEMQYVNYMHDLLTGTKEDSVRQIIKKIS
ncbi:hypothetical protein P4679_33195 [Priestia megaterium]|uniref:hypothetical protein n=1 Tax=Priestia megaterium TaxID=1404 RepID=UPI002E216D15|nr:hypothetical protein [Priestia megaterium]